MPPDALQPKAYCTNAGLQSFLLAPPGVSTRDPSSERRNYLGEKSPVISTESCDFHAYTFGFFYMPQISDMGQTALLPFRRKACWGFFFSPWKIRRLRPGLNPRTWVPKASTLPLDYQSRLGSLLLINYHSHFEQSHVGKKINSMCRRNTKSHRTSNVFQLRGQKNKGWRKWLGQGQVECCCANGNEPSGYITGGGGLWIRNC